jgi:pyridoxine 4-dehydrogenase
MSPNGYTETFSLGGDLTVRRLGFGAMRIVGRGMYEWPADPNETRRVLRRAVELGANLIDTADIYGPEISEWLIAEALQPYPPGLVIATKGGFIRGANQFATNGHPQYLWAACEASLRRLRLQRIDLYQLHAVDPNVSIEESMWGLAELRRIGRIRHIGLSNVTLDQLRRAQAIAPIASVQNRYNILDRHGDDIVAACERDGIAFMPWDPISGGALARPGGTLDQVAAVHGATPGQIALAWLLHRSPVMLPIPGTSRMDHLEENMAAARIRLTAQDLATLGR